MQKLVTIYLDNAGYKASGMLATSYGHLHGHVEEHLQPLLNEGWRVQAVTGFGGHSDGINARGWFAVVLDK